MSLHFLVKHKIRVLGKRQCCHCILTFEMKRRLTRTKTHRHQKIDLSIRKKHFS